MNYKDILNKGVKINTAYDIDGTQYKKSSTKVIAGYKVYNKLTGVDTINKLTSTIQGLIITNPIVRSLIYWDILNQHGIEAKFKVTYMNASGVVKRNTCTISRLHTILKAIDIDGNTKCVEVVYKNNSYIRFYGNSVKGKEFMINIQVATTPENVTDVGNVLDKTAATVGIPRTVNFIPLTTDITDPNITLNRRLIEEDLRKIKTILQEGGYKSVRIKKTTKEDEFDCTPIEAYKFLIGENQPTNEGYFGYIFDKDLTYKLVRVLNSDAKAKVSSLGWLHLYGATTSVKHKAEGKLGLAYNNAELRTLATMYIMRDSNEDIKSKNTENPKELRLVGDSRNKETVNTLDKQQKGVLRKTNNTSNNIVIQKPLNTLKTISNKIIKLDASTEGTLIEEQKRGTKSILTTKTVEYLVNYMSILKEFSIAYTIQVNIGNTSTTFVSLKEFLDYLLKNTMLYGDFLEYTSKGYLYLDLYSLGKQSNVLIILKTGKDEVINTTALISTIENIVSLPNSTLPIYPLQNGGTYSSIFTKVEKKLDAELNKILSSEIKDFVVLQSIGIPIDELSGEVAISFFKDLIYKKGYTLCQYYMDNPKTRYYVLVGEQHFMYLTAIGTKKRLKGLR